MKPAVVIFHSLTNDIKSQLDAEGCVKKMSTLIEKTLVKFSDTKIVLSLATPRMDRDDWNIKGELINAMLKHNFGKSEKIFFCDNSNLAEQGKSIQRLFERDGIHLSRDGTAVLVSNMKKTIDTVCKAPHRGNEQGIRYRKK